MNPEILKKTVTTAMPYGKYKGVKIADIPISYLEWYASKGFPKGELGMLMATVYEIKTNGLDEILKTLKRIN